VEYHPIGRHGAAGSRRRSVAAAIVLGGALLAAPLPAGAAELAGAELNVDSSPSAYDCPDAATLAQLAIALGSPPATPGEALRLGVHFQRGAEGYVAVIEASGRKQGTRELQNSSTTCAPLAQAVSVVLAVLTDLIPPSDDVPALIPPPRPAPAAPPPERPLLTFAAGPDFGIVYGLVGRAATATTAVKVRVRYEAAELELGALWSTPHYESVPPGIVSLSLLAETALGCLWLGGDSRVTVGGCVGLGLGSMLGAGSGYDHNGNASAVWAAGLAEAATELRLRPHWACRFAVSIAVPFTEDTFAVAPAEQGLRTSPAAIFAHFGPVYRFW